jgi:hypothetical protein
LIGNQQCWPALSNIQPFFKPRPDLLSVADWKDWKGLLYECLWWFMHQWWQCLTITTVADRLWMSQEDAKPGSELQNKLAKDGRN